jgi:hypothetical protein
MPVEQDVTAPAVEDQAKQEVPAEKGLSAADLRMGYIVGITEEGNFVFDVVGKNQGLLELLGLHDFATIKVKQALEHQQGTGDKLVFEVAKTVAALAQEVQKLTSLLKKPDNSLKK